MAGDSFTSFVTDDGCAWMCLDERTIKGPTWYYYQGKAQYIIGRVDTSINRFYVHHVHRYVLLWLGCPLIL